ncbi:MAG: hypothetical protein F9K38_12890 [Pseudorhodoplanes sp.]|nr:MAG: hypothetical protein F9K38_12890 [Pseudorhodoplanes sp.]
MPTIEQRLQALEERVTKDDEWRDVLDSQRKGLVLLLGAAVWPLCTDPTLARAIIKNLESFEDGARMTNEHAALIESLRALRDFFSRRLAERGERT